MKLYSPEGVSEVNAPLPEPGEFDGETLPEIDPRIGDQDGPEPPQDDDWSGGEP